MKIRPNSRREHHPCFTCNYDLQEKIISPKFCNNRIAALGNVTQAMTAINKRLYAYDAMSAGSIIEGNYTDLPGAK